MNVYILHSQSLGMFYTGISKFRQKRHRQHLKGQTAWTSRANDWIEVWSVEVPDVATARALEKAIKARSARRFLEDRGVAVPPEAG